MKVKTNMTKYVSRLSVVLGCLLLLLAIPSSGPTGLYAQTPTGYSWGPVTNASFYHIAAGHQDEWLALYKKYHYPIMHCALKAGLGKSETLYKRGIHALSPARHFIVMFVY